MRPLLLIGWIGSAVVALAVAPASAQVVRCEDASGKAVYRNANDCAKGKVRGEVVQVYAPPPVVQPPMTPKQLQEQHDRAVSEKADANYKAQAEAGIKSFKEWQEKTKIKPLKFGPNAPGCGTGPGMPRC